MHMNFDEVVIFCFLDIKHFIHYNFVVFFLHCGTFFSFILSPNLFIAPEKFISHNYYVSVYNAFSLQLAE